MTGIKSKPPYGGHRMDGNHLSDDDKPHQRKEKNTMTVKQVYQTIASATCVTVHVAKTDADALNERETSHFSHGVKDIPESIMESEVKFLYPLKKDLLEVWIVKDIALESALEKIGKDGVEFLKLRSIKVNEYLCKNKEALSSKNEGRIEGYIQCLKHFGILNNDELTAISLYFPDKIEEGLA